MKILNLILLFCVMTTVSLAQTSEFTYQGRLLSSGLAAMSPHDLEFAMYDAAVGGEQLGTTITLNNVPVSDGVFTVNLDFGNIFTGAARYLEIRVKTVVSPEFTTLTPRQFMSSSPYAARSQTSSSSDSLSANCDGCVTNENIESVSGSKIVGAVATAASAITLTAILPITRGGTGSTTKNFVDLTTNQTVAGNKTFTGTLSGDGSGITNIDGRNIAAGTVTTNTLAPEALPNNHNLTLLGSLRWDLLKGQATFAVGSSPHGMAFDGENIWVVNRGSNNVTKLRAKDGAILGTFSVGTNPLALAYDGTNIWVINSGSNNVTRLRASDGSNQGTFAAGTSPSGIAFDGANMWISNSISSGRVRKLRASDGVEIGSFPTGVFPTGVVFDGANIWVTNMSSDTLTKLRASDGVNLGTFGTPPGPASLAFDGTHIWVSNQLSPAILTKFRASDGVILGDFPSTGSHCALAFDGVNVWCAGGTQVIKVRITDGIRIGSFPSEPSFGIAFDGANMWVTNSGSGTVTRLPPAFP